MQAQIRPLFFLRLHQFLKILASGPQIGISTTVSNIINDFFLKICNNIVMIMIDIYIPEKNSKSNNKLDLVNTFFGVTYKSFY